MKIQTPTEFLIFNDGKCKIYNVKANKIADMIMPPLNFGNRTLGMQRYYSAKAATVEITRLIQVTQQCSITSANRVVIENEEYKIEQVQHLDDTNPRATVLTLHKIGVT